MSAPATAIGEICRRNRFVVVRNETDITSGAQSSKSLRL